MVMRRGFTLMELLTVVTLIAVLSGLLLASVGLLRDRSKRSRTEAIIAQAMAALALTRAETGAVPAPAEHPLAGSAPVGGARPLFVRGADSVDPVGGTALLAAGAGVATTGPVFSGLAAHEARAPRDALLLASDVFSGGSAGDPRATVLPLLYGHPRGRSGVVGAPALLGTPATAADDSVATPQPLASVTAWRIVSRGDAPRALDADSGHLHAPALTLQPGTAVRQQVLDYHRRALAHALGGGAAQKELGELGALVEADEEVDAALMLAGRVARGEGEPAGSWQPGRVLDAGAWRPYRLRGLALYDAWGRELLYSVDRGNPVVVSAGSDGVFALHPGADGRYQSAPQGPLAGDDRDGAHDNVLTVEVE